MEPEFDRLSLCPELSALRKRAKEQRDPTCCDETLSLLLSLCPKEGGKVLEIGAAEGLTACAILTETQAEYVGIESDPLRAAEARKNFSRFQVSGRALLYEGDAGEILPMMETKFDLIFLDGPKAQYKSYFPYIKRLLKGGGVLLSDDVLLFGWVRGNPPPKRRMLIEHIREYLEILQNDGDFTTEIFPFGEGLAVSKKLGR